MAFSRSFRFPWCQLDYIELQLSNLRTVKFVSMDFNQFLNFKPFTKQWCNFLKKLTPHFLVVLCMLCNWSHQILKVSVSFDVLDFYLQVYCNNYAYIFSAEIFLIKEYLKPIQDRLFGTAHGWGGGGRGKKVPLLKICYT